MDTTSPDIEVVITFLRTEEGGRTCPVFSGYRPQFYYEKQDWDAEHTYFGVEQVKPGDTVTARLTFTRPHMHLGRICVGTEFLLREGSKTVAKGHVTEILHLEDNAKQIRDIESKSPNI